MPTYSNSFYQSLIQIFYKRIVFLWSDEFLSTFKCLQQFSKLTDQREMSYMKPINGIHYIIQIS